MRISILLFAVLTLANCASAPSGNAEALAEHQKINDPGEPTNRFIFKFNQGSNALAISVEMYPEVCCPVEFCRP